MTVATNAQRNEFVVLDRKKGASHPEINELSFSPDGRRLAYRVRQPRSLPFCVLDGQRRRDFDWASAPFFGKESIDYLAAKGRSLYRVRP